MLFGLTIITQSFLAHLQAESRELRQELRRARAKIAELAGLRSLVARVAQQDAELDRLRLETVEVRQLRAQLAEAGQTNEKLVAEMRRMQRHLEERRASSGAAHIPGVVLPPDVSLQQADVFDLFKLDWIAEETAYHVSRGLHPDKARVEAERAFKQMGRAHEETTA